MLRAAWKGFWLWQKNWPLYLLVLVIFTLGALLGAFTANNLPAGQLAEIHSYLGAFLSQVGSLQIDPARVARVIMDENIIISSAIYFLGLTFAGIPFILGLIFARGFILGFAIACLTKAMSWPGLILAVVSILPHNLFYLPALVIGGVASISFASLTIKRSAGYRFGPWRYFLDYTVVMLAVMAVTLGAGLIEVYFSPWLTRQISGFIL